MKLLKEPALYFVIIGGLLFAFYQKFDPNALEPGDDEVVVTSGRIEQLATVFQKTWQRPPTREELEGQVDDFILQEIYYREAKAAGLDQDDTLIRRRLRQKLEFLTDDLAATEPTDAELEEFIEKNPDRFALPGSLSFRQIFFNPDKLGDRPDEALGTAAALLEEGKEPEGHSTLLPATMRDATPIQITGTYGQEFADRVAGLEAGNWVGPIRSTYGFHFVKVDDRKAGGMPDLDQVKPQVQRGWEHEQRERFREEFNRKLLEKYDVSVEWPKSETPAG